MNPLCYEVLHCIYTAHARHPVCRVLLCFRLYCMLVRHHAMIRYARNKARIELTAATIDNPYIPITSCLLSELNIVLH
jgi:hypothetical protein